MRKVVFQLAVLGLVCSGCAVKSIEPRTPSLGTKVVPRGTGWVSTPEAEARIVSEFKKYVREQDLEFVFCAEADTTSGRIVITNITIPTQSKFRTRVEDVQWAECPKTTVAWGHAHPELTRHDMARHDSTTLDPEKRESYTTTLVASNKQVVENLSDTDISVWGDRPWRYAMLVYTDEESGEIVFKLFVRQD